MSNMSYCRFENTLSDLQDCFDAMENGQIADSEEEFEARMELISLCKEIGKSFGHLKNVSYSDVYCDNCGDTHEDCECVEDEDE